MFPVCVPRIFKTVGRPSVVKSRVIEVPGEISVFYNCQKLACVLACSKK